MDRSVTRGSQRSEAAARSGSQPKGDRRCCWCLIFSTLAVASMMLVIAFGVALPVHVTVTDASVASLDLAVAGNGPVDATSLSSVAYNLSLTFQLRNPNWAMWVDLTVPLDAQLRFAGWLYDGARMADAGTISLPPGGAKKFRVLAASSPFGYFPRVVSGADIFTWTQAVKELRKERAEGVFQVELRIAGEVRYRPVHAGRSSMLEAKCPLKMLMPNGPRGAHKMVVLQDGVVSCY